MTIYEIEDVCQILKIGKNTAYDLVRTKELQAFKIHGIWKIPQSSLENYLKEQTGAGT